MKEIVVEWWDEKPPARASRRVYSSKMRLTCGSNRVFSCPLDSSPTIALMESLTIAGRVLVRRVDGPGVLGGMFRSSYEIIVDIYQGFDWDGEDHIHARIRDAFRLASHHAFPGEDVRLVFVRQGQDGEADSQYDQQIPEEMEREFAEAEDYAGAEEVCQPAPDSEE